MKNFDVLVVGSGSGTTIVDGALRSDMKVALVDKDRLGGLCLNRGCIPSKMVIYPADIVNMIRDAEKLGVIAEIKEIDFSGIMERMRKSIEKDVEHMRESISKIKELTFYNMKGEFIDDYTMRVGEDTIKAKYIFLVSGSRPLIPPIEGIDEIDYLTNRNVWDLTEKPRSMILVGGGFVSVEMAHFFSAMGTEVTLLSRSSRLLKEGEPEISETLLDSMKKRMKVLTNAEVVEVSQDKGSVKAIVKHQDGTTSEHEAEKIFLGTGRRGNADLLKCEKTGVQADDRGFIKVNKHYETTKDRIWAFGDAIGKALFKHVANKEAELVWHSFSQGHKQTLDYDKVPYAVYGWPQIASVGLTQREAEDRELDILVGYYNYRDTAKGMAMRDENSFVKVVVEENDYRVLGAHIIGPYSPILIHESINILYCESETVDPIYEAIHIHPALSEVVKWAFQNLRKPGHRHVPH
jgi:dihydrolipoamide dehydrogenase